MEVRFYQLNRDPVEKVVPLLAAKVLEAGDRLVVVSGDAEQRAALSQALWERETAFLAHGMAGEPCEARQPLVLGGDCNTLSGAQTALIADGVWRAEAETFERVILLLAAEQTVDARQLWVTLESKGHAMRIFKQREDGGWREGR